MTFALQTLSLEGDGQVACLVRVDDGAFIPLKDAQVLLDLMESDPGAYVALLSLAKRVGSKFGASLDA